MIDKAPANRAMPSPAPREPETPPVVGRDSVEPRPWKANDRVRINGNAGTVLGVTDRVACVRFDHPNNVRTLGYHALGELKPA